MKALWLLLLLTGVAMGDQFQVSERITRYSFSGDFWIHRRPIPIGSGNDDILERYRFTRDEDGNRIVELVDSFTTETYTTDPFRRFAFCNGRLIWTHRETSPSRNVVRDQDGVLFEIPDNGYAYNFQNNAIACDADQIATAAWATDEFGAVNVPLRIYLYDLEGEITDTVTVNLNPDDPLDSLSTGDGGIGHKIWLEPDAVYVMWTGYWEQDEPFEFDWRYYISRISLAVEDHGTVTWQRQSSPIYNTQSVATGTYHTSRAVLRAQQSIEPTVAELAKTFVLTDPETDPLQAFAAVDSAVTHGLRLVTLKGNSLYTLVGHHLADGFKLIRYRFGTDPDDPDQSGFFGPETMGSFGAWGNTAPIDLIFVR